MLKRALVIAILILVTVAATLPFGESLASYGRRAVAGRAGTAKAKRRSRAWWRRRRAHLRRQRAVAAARRRQRAWALRRRRGATSARASRVRRGTTTARRTALPVGTANLSALLAPARLPSVSPSSVESIPALEERAKSTPVAAPALAHAAPVVVVAAAAPRPLLPAASPSPFLKSAPGAGHPVSFAAASSPAANAAAREAHQFSSLPVPRSWLNVSSTLGGEFKFSLRGAEGRAVGTAVWSRLALAPSAAAGDRRSSKTLGGVSHAAMRRTVIDRMVAEGGWVVNDFERDLNGQRVFVVVAHSEGENGARRNWTYYFTETDGQLYSLSTTAPAHLSDAVAADAERVVSTVASRARAAAAATTKPRN